MGDRSTGLVTYLPASLLRALAARSSTTLPWCHEVDGTMVMADLSGFTALSERLAKLGDEGAERLTAVINSFFEKMLETAARYGGDTLTFGGDAILLLYDGDEHAARAVAASLEMLKQVDRSAAVEGGDGKVKIGMSVGAHSDTFVLGAAGLADERAHLFVLGRGAEMTALVEAQAERGQLAVSPSTKKWLSGRVKTARAGDFWRVEEFTGQGHRHAAEASVPASKPSPAAERFLIPEYDPRLLTPFLPPYARGDGEGAGGRVQHQPEHRRTVIAFVNILGLNDVIASQGVDAALGQLQSYSAVLTRLAAKHHGFVVSSDIATQGSKLVITFGTPVAHEYAPANAARFALDLTEGLRQSGLDLRHKIGLNGGHVFAGEVGPESRRQYTVMGDAVNLAARLMGAAAPGQVLVSRDTLGRAGSTLCGRELPSIKVKGKERPVEVCLLEEERYPTGRAAPRAGRDQAGRGRGGPGRAGDGRETGGVTERLFGRAAELDLLQSRWEAARRGEGQAVLLEGEAGVGKTRIVEEALQRITCGPSASRPRVTRAACFEHLQAAPFTPWVDVLLAILGTSRDDRLHERTVAVRTYLEARLPDQVELGSLLNPLLNLALPPSEVVGSLDAQTRRQRLFGLVLALLAEAAGDGGHVVVLEDLHWMDESSLALVRHVVEHLAGARVLLLLTTRPVEELGLEEASTTSVVLAELSEAESLAMVRAALGIAEIPPEVSEAVYAKTRGNPLFLEEVIRSLQAPGVLDRILAASSVTRAAELAVLAIPDRVQGLLMARIDRLPDDTRDVLKAGAVIGRSFDEQALDGMGDGLLQQVDVCRAFDELIAAALVVRDELVGAGTVTFRHALVQDVAYESLPFARRRDLHLRAARHLERGRAAPDHGLLVHHYRHAGDAGKTRVHAAKAAEASVAVYASREAIDYLSLALDTVTGRSPYDACLRSRFDELIADSLETLARHEEAIRSYLAARRRWRSAAVRRVADEALRDIAPISDVDVRESELSWKLAVSTERGLAAYRRALGWLDKAAEALPPDRQGLGARILLTKSAVLSRLGRCEEALGIGEEGVALARHHGDPSLQAYGLAMLANALFGLGLLERAIEADTEAVALYDQAGDLAGQALSHGNLAANYQLTGDLRAALEHHELSLSFYARLDFKTGMAVEHSNLGELLLQMGDTEEALRHLEEAIHIRDDQGLPPALAGFALVNLCRARLRLGEEEAAERALQEGRGLLQSVDAQGLLLDAGVMETELHLDRGDLDGAQRCCAAVLAQARGMKADLSEAQALCLQGRILFARGEAAKAVGELQACVALTEKTGSDYERAQALVVLAEVHASCGDGGERCEGVLCEAIRLFEKMGARYDLEGAVKLRERLVSTSS